MRVLDILVSARSKASAVVVLGAALLVATAAAYGQAAFDYNVQPRTFRACRLLLPYQAGGNWVAPTSGTNRTAIDQARSLIFEGMRRYPGKPAGWDIENPLAPTAVIASDPNPANRILKNDPAYWEVQLDPDPATTHAAATPATAYTAPDLTKFDLIYIWAGGQDSNGVNVTIDLSLACYRAALLDAVHAGAVLWIDQKRDANGTTITNFAPPGDLQLPGIQPFTFTVGAQTSGTVRHTYGNWTNFLFAKDRLLSYPFLLQDARDVQYLGMYPRSINTSGYPPTGVPGSVGESATLDSLDLNDTSFQRVVNVWDGSNWLNNIAVARYGAGAIVVSAGDVGYDVVNWWAGANRNQPLQQETADCKFAWNTAALGGNFQQSQGGSTASGASNTAVPAPLSIGWQYPDRFDTTPLGPVLSSPVYANGMVYAVSLPYLGAPARQAMLMCFDADPARDLDGDGQADDGVDTNGDGVNDFIDYSVGHSYDMVWSVNLGANLTPRTAGVTVATMQLATGQQRDVVLVSLVSSAPGNGSVGYVRAYDARTGSNGVALWSKTLGPYDAGGGSNGMVVDLSTPVVFKDFVYVLASEYDPNADAVAGPGRAYGRAHAFSLNYTWTVANDAGPKWSYPERTNNPAGDGDTAPGGAGNTDHATREYIKTLPSFQDPYWVAGAAPYNPRPLIPPFPTPRPVVTEPTGPLANSGVNVMLQCATPYSLRWLSNVVDIDPDHGGSDYALIPTPKGPAAGDPDLLNPYYYRVWLPQGVTVANTQLLDLTSGAPSTIVTRPPLEDGYINANARAATWQDPADGRIYATFSSGNARELLLPSQGSAVAPSAPDGIMDPLRLSQGAGLLLSYRVSLGPAITVNGKLPGPVAQVVRLPVNQRRIASGSISGGSGLSASDTLQDNSGTLRNFDYTAAYSGDAGSVTYRDTDSGVVQWQYRPHRALPDSGTRAQLGKSGGAFERNNGTGFTAVTSALNPDANNDRALVPQILGFNLDPRLRVQLNGAPDTQVRPGANLTVSTIGANGTAVVTIPASVVDATTQETHQIYQLEPTTRSLTFATDQAAWVDDGTANPPGCLWGKPIWVTYTRTTATPGDTAGDVNITNELHVLPDILRFQYTPGIIRLRHGLVGISNALAPTFSLPNGTPLTRNFPSGSLDETHFSALMTGLPGAWTEFMPRGLLDVRYPYLTLPGGEAVLPGTDIIVTYDYYDEATGLVATARERQQVPLNFGASAASPVLADRTLHIGTEGYLPTGMRGAAYLLGTPDPNNAGLPVPLLGFNSSRKSLLSVLFDPITDVVRGSLSEAVIPEATTYANNGTPVVNGAAAIDAGGVVVGSHLMTRLSQVSAATASPAGYQTEGVGFVSRLKPERTLICDNTRLIEVVGQKPAWVCMGSMAPAYHEGLDVGTLGNQELKVTPFARPAKAIYLTNGNILVADSGNDRVVEIDRTGRQIWPVDQFGYDYYTSNQNHALDLQRPSDCFRYYVTKVGNTTYTSANGDMLPATATSSGSESHTVIADAGNERVVDVVTTVNALGVQTHRVDILSPSTVRLATQSGTSRLSYTRAIPIFDPTTNQIDGYLCVAANLHQLVVLEAGSRMINPPANRALPSGTGTWQWLAWLYDHDPATGNLTNVGNNPLIFRNIRDVQLAREGTREFVTVTAERFDGRMTRLAEIVAGQPVVVKLGMNAPPHFLATQGAGVFEYCINISGAPATWSRFPATDANPGDTMNITADDPIWWFTRPNYLFGDPASASPTRRSLTNVRYSDVDGTTHWMEMAWNPVSAMRLPADTRPVNGQRQSRHLVTNYAEIIQNLNRDSLHSNLNRTAGTSDANDAIGPASLFSSVLVINTDDRTDNAPDNDLHDLDRREVIPDPNDADWSDPFNQPAYADRN